MREAQRFLIHELGGHVSDALAMETRLALRQREWQEEQAVRAFERAAAERGDRNGERLTALRRGRLPGLERSTATAVDCGARQLPSELQGGGRDGAEGATFG